jgi:PKD repeat protein
MPGTLMTLTATPKPGYIFVNWTDSATNQAVSDSANYSFTATKDLGLYGNFAPITKTLASIQVSSGPQQVNESSTAQYECTATYSDSTTADVTSSASWSVNTTYASISGGALTTLAVPSDQACQISVGYGGKTAIANITIKNGASLPTISSISPNSGPTAGGNSVTILGTNLQLATSVTFGGVAATIVYDSNTGYLKPVVPAHTAGSVNVVVTTPSGSTTSTNGYNYIDTQSNQPPSVSSGPIAIPSAPVVQQLVHFSIFAQDPDGDPLSYKWDFGDGSANADSATPSHFFLAAGSYSVTVTCSDGHTTPITKSMLVTVTQFEIKETPNVRVTFMPQIPPRFSFTNEFIKAFATNLSNALTASDESGFTGLAVLILGGTTGTEELILFSGALLDVGIEIAETPSPTTVVPSLKRLNKQSVYWKPLPEKAVAEEAFVPFFVIQLDDNPGIISGPLSMSVEKTSGLFPPPPVTYEVLAAGETIDASKYPLGTIVVEGKKEVQLGKDSGTYEIRGTKRIGTFQTTAVAANFYVPSQTPVSPFTGAGLFGNIADGGSGNILGSTNSRKNVAATITDFTLGKNLIPNLALKGRLQGSVKSSKAPTLSISGKGIVGSADSFIRKGAVASTATVALKGTIDSVSGTISGTYTVRLKGQRPITGHWQGLLTSPQ